MVTGEERAASEVLGGPSWEGGRGGNGAGARAQVMAETIGPRRLCTGDSALERAPATGLLSDQ